MSAVLEIVGAVVGAAALGWVGWLTYKATRRGDVETAAVAKETNAIAWSAQLLARLDSVEKKLADQDLKLEEQEKRINALSRVSQASLSYIERVLQWVKAGSKPPMPSIPPAVKEHLDPALIRDHDRQKRGTKE